MATAYVRFKLHEAAAAADDPADPLGALSAEQLELLNTIVLDPNDQLSAEQKQRVRKLLAHRIRAFALDPKEPAHTHLMSVALPILAGASAHRHAPSRLGDVGMAIVDKHVGEMGRTGIIRKSNSALGSRVVLVSKKDGSTRFCVDCRDLNSKLRLKDRTLPLTGEAIDRLSSGNATRDSLFLTTLDLASGFCASPVASGDSAGWNVSSKRAWLSAEARRPLAMQASATRACRR